MELGADDVAAARALYRRCIKRLMEPGGAAVLAEAWLRMERERGSADALFEAELFTKPVLAEAAAAAEAGANAQAAAVAQVRPCATGPSSSLYYVLNKVSGVQKLEGNEHWIFIMLIVNLSHS